MAVDVVADHLDPDRDVVDHWDLGEVVHSIDPDFVDTSVLVADAVAENATPLADAASRVAAEPFAGLVHFQVVLANPAIACAGDIATGHCWSSSIVVDGSAVDRQTVKCHCWTCCPFRHCVVAEDHCCSESVEPGAFSAGSRIGSAPA